MKTQNAGAQIQELLHAGILVFDEVEVLDFAGPFEVFSAARLPGGNDDAPPLFHVATIAPELCTVRCRGGLEIVPQFSIDDSPALDLLIVPGGKGTEDLLRQPAVIDWLRQQQGQVQYLASVCTGSFVLAEAGLLDSLEATSHWRTTRDLARRYPAVWVVENRRVVEQGNIWTSAGISAGIDMSLRLLARLKGDEVARWTAQRMEYLSPDYPAPVELQPKLDFFG